MGRFIVLEGPDGSGKSTLARAVAEHLAARGREPVLTRDPDGTAVGAAIREILLDPARGELAPMAELLLFCASRAQLVAEVIRPALAEGRVVLSDRFTLSTLAYQGVLGVVEEPELRRLVTLSAGGLRPDHVVLLDVPPETGLRRLGREPDRMERKGLAFQEEVRQRYLGYADGAPEGSVTVVDASAPLETVRRRVLEIVEAACD